MLALFPEKRREEKRREEKRREEKRREEKRREEDACRQTDRRSRRARGVRTGQMPRRGPQSRTAHFNLSVNEDKVGFHVSFPYLHLLT